MRWEFLRWNVALTAVEEVDLGCEGSTLGSWIFKAKAMLIEYAFLASLKLRIMGYGEQAVHSLFRVSDLDGIGGVLWSFVHT